MVERLATEAGGTALGGSEREAVLAAISASELGYRRLFESAQGGIMILDAETGVVCDVNPYLLDLLGYAKEDICGKQLWELGFISDIVASKASFLELQSKDYVRYEDLPLQTAGGERKDVEFVSNVYLAGSHKVILCNIRDITDRKLAENALRESERKLSETQRLAQLGYWQWDVATGKVEWSERVFSIFQLDPAEFTPQIDSILALSPWPEEHQRDTELIQRAVENHEPGSYEQRFLYPDGSTGHYFSTFQGIYDEQGNLSSIVGTIRDITERKYAESALATLNEELLASNEEIRATNEELHATNKELESTYQELELAIVEVRKSEEKYRTLTENIPQRIFVKNHESVYTFGNRKYVAEFGLTPEQFAGKTDFDLYPADLAEKHRADDKRIMEDGRTVELEEHYVINEQATWVAKVKTPVRNMEGLVVGIQGIFWDITERKLAEAEVRQLNAELEQRVEARTAQLAEANSELEAFAHSVSHDLRAPLRGIDGWSMALLEDYGDQLDAQGREYLDRVRAETQRMGHLIDDMLMLSRVGRAAMQTGKVDLSATARVIAERLARSQPERQVEIVIEPGLSVNGDAKLLEIALENLLDNAWKFTSKRGSARIEVGAISNSGQDDQVFFIRDNGAGFDMAYEDKLFKPFQRLHRVSDFPGTGIGLVTAQRILRRHGGKIWVEAQVDHGATFYFTL